MKKRKFTLIELLITLGILAALTTLLLDNFADIKLREKELQNEEQGRKIQVAMTTGDVKNSYSQYLSDMGRRPRILFKSTENNYGERFLAFLYDRTLFYHNSPSNTMLNHLEEIDIDETLLDVENITSPYSFPTAQLNVGWNGPYINLFKPEDAKFVDAWGNNYKLLVDAYLKKNSSDNLIQEATIIEDVNIGDENKEVDGIASFGADNKENGDLISTKDSYFYFSHDDNLANLNISLKIRDESNSAVFNDVPNDANQVTVLIFSPAERVTTNSITELGFFRLKPFDTSTIDYSLEYPVLKYADNTNATWVDPAESNAPYSYTFGTNRNKNRGRVKSNWHKNNIANFKVEWLIPGKRKIYAFAGKKIGATNYEYFVVSNVEWLDLRRGENYITLYLERKN